MSLSSPETTRQKHPLWQPGVSANPAGRPKGSKNKLGEAFVAALHEDFQEHGVRVIETVRVEKPDVYLKVIAQIIPKEFTIKTDAFDGITDEQLAAIVAAARASLGIIEGSAIDVSPEAGGEPSQILPPVQEAG